MMSSTYDEQQDGNAKMPFPFKLFQMLRDAEEQGLSHIVGWNKDGKSFKVHDSVAFTKTIVPKYFKQTRYKSFQRQLCLYGFDRVIRGPQKGSRYHESFQRDNFRLCSEVKYIGIKSKFQQAGKSGAHDLSQTTQIVDTTSFSLDQSERSDVTLVTVPEPLSYASPVSQTGLVHIAPTRISPTPSLQDFSKHLSVSEELSSLHGLDMDDFGIPILDESHFDETNTTSFPTIVSLEGYQSTGISSSNSQNDSSNQHAQNNAPLSSTQMHEAWQRGFEMALSMPAESCLHLISEFECKI